MDWLVAAILGVVQGLTEFLPISSSAHLLIVGEFLMPGEEPGAFFTAIIQIGTETAVVVYFWRDIVRIISSWCKAVVGKLPHSDPDARMGWFIILGSIPIGVLGLLLEDYIETTLRSLWITATMLIVFGILLGIADRYGKSDLQLEDLTVKRGIMYGIGQALALIPGVSRSGGTITVGRMMGFDREAAARYSFLLAIPAVMGSGFFSVYKSFEEPMVLGWGPTLLATVIAFLVGIVVIAWFLKFISHRSFAVFVWYRVILGFAIYGMLSAGILTA